MIKLLSVILCLSVLYGCSNAPVKPTKPNVTSNPDGAEVYANGTKLGNTPLSQNLYKVFPAGWKNLVYQAAGVLMIKLEGCKDYVLDVNDYVLSQPIHADLSCYDRVLNHNKIKDKAETSIPSTSNPLNPTDSEISLEVRLRKAKDLHQKGLINDQEYRQIKARILNEL